MAASLVAVTSGPASAACNSYAGCFDTETVATAPKVVKKKARATVCGTVSVIGGNARPEGDLRFTVTRNRGKVRIVRTVPYFGGKMCMRTKKLKKTGGYTVRVAYVPSPGSVFNPSSGST